ncbi:T9SS type A sorting domain-containing protein [candidate division WOR-3 bacterium]|nr:T9SS type A sorting domain-containing protein [candidate division WOR-3 bacterium]
MRTLVDKQSENPGRKTVYWNGMDNNNRPVTAGIYFCRLTAEERTATKKIVVVK